MAAYKKVYGDTQSSLNRLLEHPQIQNQKEKVLELWND